HIALNGNELSADGPSDEGRWFVYFFVRAPRGADLDLESENGPLSIDTVDGTIRAHAQNGPVPVKDSAGKIDVSAQHGRVRSRGASSSGRVRRMCTCRR